MSERTVLTSAFECATCSWQSFPSQKEGKPLRRFLKADLKRDEEARGDHHSLLRADKHRRPELFVPITHFPSSLEGPHRFRAVRL